MGTTVLAVLCWLAITQVCLGVSGAGVNYEYVDASGESAPRLYRNAPVGVYASNAPHGAFSFQVPTRIVLKPTQLIPVNQESIVIEKSKGFLKDSYGNQFVAPSQSLAYKTTYPQQYVQLQHLPDHLAQPLSAAPSYHFPQGPTQAFFDNQYRLPSPDAVTSPFTRYGVTHPHGYAGGVKSLTPASDQQFQFVSPAQTQQNYNNNNQVIYGTRNFSPVQNEPNFQRFEEKPARHIEHYEAQRQPQVAQSIKTQVQTPVRHTVKTTHNGKDTVVQIETKPPLPLLDLSLLEPLTFANPVVPQVQHYLPKINAVTYKELHPADVDEVKKHKNEFVVQKSKSYDSGVVKGKPHSDEPKKKRNKPPKKDTNVHVHYEQKSEKPSIKVKGKPNDAEYSYEIQSPNYKETYNEQVVSYNKETKNDPVTYTYQKETQKEPVTYSFSHSSADPGQVKNVQYVKKDPAPNHLVYQFQPEQQSVNNNDGHQASPEAESEDSSESDDENVSYDHAQYDTHPDKPSHSYQLNPASHSHNSHPSTSSDHSQNPTHSHSSQSHHPSTYSHNPTHAHSSQSHHPSSHSHNPTHAHSSQSHHSSSHSHNPTHAHSSQSHHPSTHSHHPTHSHSPQSHHPSTHSHNPHSHSSQSHHPTHSDNPTHSHSSTQSHHPSTHSHDPTHPHSASQSHHPTPHSHSGGHAHPSPHPHYSAEHPTTHSHQPQQHSNAEQESHNPNQAFYPAAQKSPQYYNHPLLTPLQDFMENLRFIPSFANAAIRVDPNQHVQPTTPRSRSEAQLSAEPVIYEKSKKIIIQEESPDEMHSHQEKLTAQMVGKEENNEEDFEKSYKEAAYGFPAYDRDSRESEEEIYNPENYGEPHNSEEETGKHFEEYHEEGDEFPKFARLGYKDTRDKTKESYFQDYSIQKPESMTDRYQSKINYYKMFLKSKPEKLRHSGPSNNNKELAKYTVAPSFFDSAPKQKSKQSAAYKAAPAFEYDYLKDSRDSSAHASRPNLRYKSRTHFVEPQFQYGFEPIAIPRLDSELDTMASNVSPESEKPGTRKKVYKENWYIKKTSTSSKPS